MTCNEKIVSGKYTWINYNTFQYRKNVEQNPAISRITIQEEENAHNYKVMEFDGKFVRSDENLQTVHLMNFLNNKNIFERLDETKDRENIIRKIDTLFKTWVMKICSKQGLAESTSNQVGGIALPLGSYMFGSQDEETDLDILCLAPVYVSRTHFFTSFKEELAKFPGIKHLNAIETAFVPIIKLVVNDVQIDLLFARLQYCQIPDNFNLMDTSLIKQLDPKCIRSINGYKVTMDILNSVPNFETFKLTLKAVKFWARQRFLYCHVIGFLGGISWTILVGRICQLYPNANMSMLILKFFEITSLWRWPSPFQLLQTPNIVSGYRGWNPHVNPLDALHLLPIITPTYPQQNTCVHVSTSTKSIIMEELNRGCVIVKSIMRGETTWDNLYEPMDFFGKYNHFLLFKTSAKTPDDHLEWNSLFRSKIRLLTDILQTCPMVEIVHPLSKCYNFGDTQSSWFVGVKLVNYDKLYIDLDVFTRRFIRTVINLAIICGKYKDGMVVMSVYVSGEDVLFHLPLDAVQFEEKHKRKRRESETEYLNCKKVNKIDELCLTQSV